MDADKFRDLFGNRPFNFGSDGTVICYNSRGYILSSKCEKCQKSYDFILWIIVDGEKRPDLLKKIMRRKLHCHKCVNCGHKNRFAGDLLLFRPNKRPVLLFSPTKGISYQEQQKIARSFLIKLKDQLGQAWNNEWYEKDGKRGMFIVNRKVLPIAIRLLNFLLKF